MKKEKKENARLWATLFVISTIIVLLLLAYIIYGFIQDTTKNKVEEKEPVPVENNASVIEGNYYLLEDLVNQKRRFYIAMDDNSYLAEGKTYLLDTYMSTKKNVFTEYNIREMFKESFDAKTSTLPDILAPGTANETKLEDCTLNAYFYNYSKKIESREVNYQKELPVLVSYACRLDSGVAINIGSEVYVLNVEEKKFYDVGSVSEVMIP